MFTFNCVSPNVITNRTSPCKELRNLAEISDHVLGGEQMRDTTKGDEARPADWRFLVFADQFSVQVAAIKGSCGATVGTWIGTSGLRESEVRMP